ncbi:MAG: response regulator [Magnetococcales bacterium]|nr:hypothetical protein [Magnetococcales bacterium]NGZ06791.1 response regulator [Magnetococcales bacterium]
MARTIQVLVIEGDRLSRILLRGILEGEGLQVIGAGEEQMGVSVVRAAPCDLLIGELMLSEIEDEAILPVLLREFPELRIIVLGGREVCRRMQRVFPEPLRSSRLRILEKPVFRQELLRTIQELFPEWQPMDLAWEQRGL